MRKVCVELKDEDYIKLGLLVAEGRYVSMQDAIVSTIKGLLWNYSFPELGEDISHLSEKEQEWVKQALKEKHLKEIDKGSST